MHFIGHVSPVKRKVKREPVATPDGTIAQLWGNESPAGEMSERRERWAKWEKRKQLQRERDRV
jgi:hypothetical protein